MMDESLAGSYPRFSFSSGTRGESSAETDRSARLMPVLRVFLLERRATPIAVTAKHAAVPGLGFQLDRTVRTDPNNNARMGWHKDGRSTMTVWTCNCAEQKFFFTHGLSDLFGHWL